MNEFLVMTMTDAGRLSALNYADSGFSLGLSHIGVGSGNYVHTTKTTAMAKKWADFPIVNATVDETNHCLIVNTMGQVNDVINVSELGLYGVDGQLIATVAKPSGYFFKTEPGAFFSFTVSIALGQQIKGKKLNLSFASQDQIITALLALHVQHKNPHPQYRAFMAELIKQHLNSASPHEYTLQTELTAALKQYSLKIDRMMELFMGFFGQSIYMGRYYNNTGHSKSYTVEMSKNFSGDLRDSATGIFFTPEGNHEAWQITRYEKSVQCETWQRNGRGRSAYYGHVNWLFLSDSTGSPNAEMAMPELIEVGLAQPRPGGYLDLTVSENEKAPFHELCVLICPEQHHEGWNIVRNANTRQLNIHAFRRKDVSRGSWDYTGKINYAILRPKDGTDLTPPSFFPALLMAGVGEMKSNGNFFIRRPPGQTWDFRDENFIIQLCPDAEHEGWSLARSEDNIEVHVYERSKVGRYPQMGRCSYAIFQKEPDMEMYREGKYTITIPAQSTAEIHLVGAGGSGAGSLWAANHFSEWFMMEPGQDSSFKIGNSVNLIAGGGAGGTRGVWNNGSAYLQGQPGKAGIAKVDKLGTAKVITQMNGENAYLHSEWEWTNRDTRGGQSRWKFGAGGAGGYTVETNKHRCYGGGGGSGAYIHFTVSNPSSAPITAELVVGAAGSPDTVTPELNNGKSGEAGSAMIRIKKND